jgi:hypothetical protein
MERVNFTFQKSNGKFNVVDSIFLCDHKELREEFERVKDVLSTPGYVPREVRHSLANGLQLLLVFKKCLADEKEIAELIQSLTSRLSPSTSHVRKAVRLRLLGFMSQLESLLVPCADGHCGPTDPAGLSAIHLQSFVTEASKRERAFVEFAKDGSNSSMLCAIGADRIEVDETSFTLTVKCKNPIMFKSRVTSVHCASFQELLESEAVIIIPLPAEEEVKSVSEDCIHAGCRVDRIPVLDRHKPECTGTVGLFFARHIFGEKKFSYVHSRARTCSLRCFIWMLILLM